ncbi:MAG: TRAP transporter small permease subunit [Proteobacteria bacterium]|jgi:TRAP-type mannitol/chloroaromatic compound transport system permease small subunit|nr:TRAP transporter small permease subunit [Ramlibacter sp.]MCA0212571.1 TRAP transporter small permease subunit [Pseudomonadota bacterium]
MNHYVRWMAHVNEWTGRISGLLIVAVVLIILKEVIARSVFNAPSLWADESMTYLAGIAYALGGGFTLLHRKHVIVDLVYQPIANRGGTLKKTVDIVAFLLFSIYCLTLIWFGWELARLSIEQHEGSGTMWNPALWPVKLAIPIAGALLLLQGFANLLVDLGLAVNPVTEQAHVG